ncbi:MAG: acyltransferase family protein, partial [Actinomycetota bacterium]
LMLVLAAVAAVAPLAAPDQNPRLRGDIAAALTYVSNWRLILQEQSYFDAIGRPPILQHLWSLAVEEQFYLLWPLLLAFGLRKGRKPQKMIKWIAVAAGASAVAMAMMYSPEADLSRLYFGTDTRIATILFGVALAFMWRPGQKAVRPRWYVGTFKDVVGVAALVLLAACMTLWNEFDPFLYQAGFVVIAALGAVSVAITTRPGPVVGWSLGNGLMQWMGKRSYAIYLWHWPVFMLTRPQLDIALEGAPLFALRLAITFWLAEATYQAVEKPLRNGALGRSWTKLKSGFKGRSPRLVVTSLTTFSLPVLVLGTVAVGAIVEWETPDSDTPALQEELEEEVVVSTTASTEQIRPVFGEIVITDTAPPPETEAAPPAPASGMPHLLTAIGDSVMLIANEQLANRFDNAIVDAGKGRQAEDILQTVRARKDAGQLGDAVVIHMGTNGVIRQGQLEELMAMLADVPRVYLLNVKVSRPWESLNNELLAANIDRWPNASLIDWKAVATQHPEMFYSDGVHLRPGGLGLYVEMIAGQVLG